MVVCPKLIESENSVRPLRREYAQFRKALLRKGFTMLQYSVYARYVPSKDVEEALRRHVHAALPSHGQVRLISVTDRQPEKMELSPAFLCPERRGSRSAVA